VAKVRAVKTISIEKIFVPGKWLSSLCRSIYSMLMIFLRRECIISLFFRFGSGIFSFTPYWQLILFRCFCKFVVFSSYRFDKLDRLFVSWMTTT
jgi:hypothetical protein